MPLLRSFAAMLVSLLCVSVSAQSEIALKTQPEPRPMPSSVQIEADLRLDVYFSSLVQGGVGLLRLEGDGIDQAQAEFRGAAVPFFYVDEDAWYALVAVDMNARPRAYKLTVLAERQSGDISFARELRIELAGFIVQEFDLPPGRAYLTGANIENQEFALLDALTSQYSPEPLWDATGFELPHSGELTTPFGAIRALNDDRQTRHTGWDQNAPIGRPVRAMAAGEARFAGWLAIRGNYVMIDHGVGVYSGYAHFSELHVQEGQRIAAGQIIGMSGNSGRSSAPHLHWEIALRGEWVDGLAFLDMWLP